MKRWWGVRHIRYWYYLYHMRQWYKAWSSVSIGTGQWSDTDIEWLERIWRGEA